MGVSIQVLCGEKDGVDLDYPRDDFRVYARLLLSALTQALFPARDKAELQVRLASPLVRGTVEARLGPVLEAFNLFGPTPFLKSCPRQMRRHRRGPRLLYSAGRTSMRPGWRSERCRCR